MPGAWVLLMMGVLALAAFVSFPLRHRASRLLADRAGTSSVPGTSSMPGTASDGEARETVSAAADGLRDTAMMLELTASMLDAGAGIGRALELLARAASPPINHSLRPVVAALAIGADWETAWQTPQRHAPEALRLRMPSPSPL